MHDEPVVRPEAGAKIQTRREMNAVTAEFPQLPGLTRRTMNDVLKLAVKLRSGGGRDRVQRDCDDVGAPRPRCRSQ